MEELIAQLEVAIEGSRELDAAIERMNGYWVSENHMRLVTGWDWIAGAGDQGGQWELPYYTTSIDAAMRLVPANWDWGVGVFYRNHLEKPIISAMCGDVRDGVASGEKGYCQVEGSAASAPLALCIAALSARQHLQR